MKSVRKFLVKIIKVGQLYETLDLSVRTCENTSSWIYNVLLFKLKALKRRFGGFII